MIYTEAAKAAKNSSDNIVCVLDKHRGWIVWNKGKKPFRYPYRKETGYITNPKVVSVLKKRKDWQIADVSGKEKKTEVLTKAMDLSKFIMRVVAPDDSAW